MEVQLTIANITTGTQQQAQNGQSKGNQSLELYSLVLVPALVLASACRLLLEWI